MLKRVVLLLLVIPLVVTLVVQSPEAAGHVVAAIVTVGAKLLDAVANAIATFLSALSHA